MATHGQTRRVVSSPRSGRGSLGRGRLFDRLRAGSLAGQGGALFGQAPAIVTAANARPSSAFGVTAGDVDGDRAIVWSRTDRAARSDRGVRDDRIVQGRAPRRRARGARGRATSLPGSICRACRRASASSIARRFRACTTSRCRASRWLGTFTTPQAAGPLRDVTVAWTADTVGQGWGIDAAMGGMRLYETMRTAGADVFIHTGDTIYADAPLAAEVKLDDGRVWRNLVTPEKSKVAETLDEFRGNHRYNLLDEHVRRFNASLSQFVIWDDHEVLNNWYPTEVLDRREPLHRAQRRAAGGAGEACVHGIHADAAGPRRSGAHLPGMPLRAARRDLRVRHAQLSRAQHAEPPGDAGDESVDPRRRAGRVAEAAAEGVTAAWKIIASDMPLGLTVTDGPSVRGRRQRRRGATARPRARDCGAAQVHPRRAHPQRRLCHGRRALLRRASLRSRARGVYRLSSVLGVRRRPGARRHVRSGEAGQDVRPRGEVSWHSGRHEAEPPAERGPAVLRDAEG